jgi:hypothetical protein
VRFAELVEAWWEASTRDLSPNTRIGYRGILDRYLLPTFGHRRADRITPAELERWYAQLLDGKASAAPRPLLAQTIRKVHHLLSSILSTAVRWGWLASLSPSTYTGGRTCTTSQRPPSPPSMRASNLVRSGASDMLFAHVLIRAASLRAAAGERTALADLRAAFAYAHDVGSRITIMAVIDYGIRILACLGRAEVGAVLVGFLDAGGLGEVYPVEGAEATARRQARETMTNELGHQEHKAAQARGAQFSYEQLIEYSLRELDDLKSADTTAPQPDVRLSQLRVTRHSGARSCRSCIRDHPPLQGGGQGVLCCARARSSQIPRRSLLGASSTAPPSQPEEEGGSRDRSGRRDANRAPLGL